MGMSPSSAVASTPGTTKIHVPGRSFSGPDALVSGCYLRFGTFGHDRPSDRIVVSPSPPSQRANENYLGQEFEQIFENYMQHGRYIWYGRGSYRAARHPDDRIAAVDHRRHGRAT